MGDADYRWGIERVQRCPGGYLKRVARVLLWILYCTRAGEPTEKHRKAEIFGNQDLRLISNEERLALRRLGRPAPADNHARGRVRRVSLCTPLISNTSLLSEPTWAPTKKT